MKKIILIGLLFLAPFMSAKSADVTVKYPALLKLKQQEFGQLIFKFMPDKDDQGFSWNYRANDPDVIWLDKSYIETKLEDDTDYSSRKGVTRVNVLGVKSTYLDHKEYETPWAIIFEGTTGKFGVNSISFYPAMPERDGDICFGEGFKNCEFSPFKSLTKAGISFKKICEKQSSAGNFEKAYILSATNKKSVYGIWGGSSGSGGSSNEFKLIELGREKEMCKNLMGGLI
ncbi:hypothetical protein [Acinetobacter seifertii]|uniref:hypothetical protein n=1 Tax=Acinetobacter seifertii TaxID=1530123 RepID=UPI000C22D0B8|nr:hypothetical protein [Acinetobacter seifertii]PJG67838.1 hypothetical protein CVD09_03815 [Acinetobacter seifertii]